MRTKRYEAAVVIVAVLLISAAHLAVSVGTHRLHVIHVVFRGLCLLPIVAAALWFGLPVAVLGHEISELVVIGGGLRMLRA